MYYAPADGAQSEAQGHGPQRLGKKGAVDAIRERTAPSINGFLGLLVGVALLVFGAFVAISGIGGLRNGADNAVLPLLGGAPVFIIGWILLGSLTIVSPGDSKVVQFFGSYIGTIRLTIVSPGDSKVVQFFGSYIGTIRAEGVRMTVPFTRKRTISVKVRNFETSELKVNDALGNPVNIAAIIVWRVADTAKAVFAVEQFQEFVQVQSESALRHIASQYPYDGGRGGEPTLREWGQVISGMIAREVADRIAVAGLEVVETRISSLAYAPEIAQAMLQRQQASAVIEARELIVEGAVTMAQQAVRQLEDAQVVAFDPSERASLVSNLLVVLSSESPTTPVVNAGR